MSHCHDEHVAHGGHDGHGHHHHEHDHSDDITPALQYSLYDQINFDFIETFNESVSGSGKAITKKTWAERMQPQPEVQSDADEQLIITVPFTEQVKLHSILLRTSQQASAPRTLRVYINKAGLDFSSIEDAAPVQTLELSQTSEVQEIPIKRRLFGNVQQLTLFFEDNYGDDSSCISYLGFRGEWMRLGRAPTNILYEAAPNPGDHKIKGTSGFANNFGIDSAGSGSRDL
ncbi:PITH domain-containing protein [Stachybotrys elegans]|uniref:PITH domain-containing protein n=1 Tax=Stachybotrys elegans TaxID=80388 RepID=A0A8K0STZ6_9HYPO|nr:PITH domain-containing protein [Stachybotrys elegans]